MLPSYQVDMLEALFGNGTVEKVLFYLLAHREGYAREMALAFSLPVSMLQAQLSRLERGGIVASRTIGKTRVFQLDPSYAFSGELQALLRRAFDYIPASHRGPYEPKRKRPRATGKPL